MENSLSPVSGDAAAGQPDGVVSVIGGCEIIKSCRHYYPAFNGNIEFKSLRQCQAFILFEHLPMMRFFAACDKDCLPMLAALCTAV